MKIYVTTHGLYEQNHISLCTTDFDSAIKHFIDYSKIDNFYNSMESIEVWEDDKLIYCYGDMNYHIINNKNEITYNELKQDFIKYFKYDDNK